MNKMLNQGETRIIERKLKPTPFVSAAGLVLGVGTGVLKLVAKGIKGAVGLLVNSPSSQPSQAQLTRSQAQMTDEKYVKQLPGEDVRVL